MRLLLPLFGLSALAGAAVAQDTCVVNQTAATHYFVAQAGPGSRAAGWLDPGESLCVATGQAADRHLVQVFEDPGAFEGCSRLVAPGRAEALLRYVDFDRCEWSSHHMPD